MFSKRLYPSMLLFLLFALASGFMPTLRLHADAYFDSLLAEIEAANRSGSGSITLTADVTLSTALPPITSTVTIEGNGYAISGANAYRIFDVDGGDLTIRNLTLTEGRSLGDAGAIFLQNGGELVVEDATFTDNQAMHGGAILTAPSSATLSIINSIFDGNSAETGGGAIFVNGGTVEIVGSTFSDNEAVSYGGAIETLNGVASIENSTFINNQAGVGGGILVSGATTTMTHLTLVDNVANDGDGIYRRDGRAYLRNSIVVGGGAALDCSGVLEESQGNLSQDGTCAIRPSGDPLLAEFTGSPGYFPLLDGSPAVDAADAEFCLETDQIDTERPQGGGCDIGAFESETAIPAEASAVSPEVCTLSDQIIAANTNTAIGACPAGTSHDIITLTEDITLSEPLPLINGTITIEGNGHTISGNNRFQIFSVAGRKLTIKDLTLTEGYRGAGWRRDRATK